MSRGANDAGDLRTVKRVYRTATVRDAERNLVSTRGSAIIVIEFEEERRLVTVAPGREEIYEATLISPHDLETDELIRVETEPGIIPKDAVFRVLTVSESRIGRNMYTLTRKLDDAD